MPCRVELPTQRLTSPLVCMLILFYHGFAVAHVSVYFLLEGMLPLCFGI